MLEILVITTICIVLVFSELKPLFKQNKKFFFAYLSLLAFAFVLWVLNGLEVKVPSPAEPIKKLIMMLFDIRG